MKREVPKVRIAVFGLGYVGTVTTACLAEEGHSLLCTDIDSAKLEKLSRGESPVLETGLSELVRKGVQRGTIRTAIDPAQAIHETDAAIICVGTPGLSDGSLDTRAVRLVAHQIGSDLKGRPGSYLIVIRSTLLPGSVSRIVIPVLETESGKKVDRDFDICLNPEFMREGSSVRDFRDPPLTVLGVRRREAADQVLQLYTSPPAPHFVTSIEVAEMIKCASNVFHALKVSFANEMGVLCRNMNMDGREVMEMLCADRKLNISRAYLEPGPAFGGSCLPKDLRAMEYLSRRVGCETPTIHSIMPSNTIHIDRMAQRAMDVGRQAVGLLGLSFKPGIDDLRESPLVELARILLDRGLDLKVFDEDVRPERLMGANRRFISRQIPELENIMVSGPEELFRHSELIIVGKLSPFALESLRKHAREDHFVLDLVGIPDVEVRERTFYSGLCWP